MELNFSLLNGSDDSVDFKKNVKVKPFFLAVA